MYLFREVIINNSCVLLVDESSSYSIKVRKFLRILHSAATQQFYDNIFSPRCQAKG